MATENVVINFTSNADQLKPTVDLLVKMGQITAKDAEEFKKLSTETTKYSQAAQGAGESAKKLTDTLGQEMAIAQGVADALIEGANKFKAGSAEKQAAVQKETLLLRQLLAVSEKTVDPKKQKEITGELVKQAQKVKELVTELGKSAGPAGTLRTELMRAKEEAIRLAQEFGEFSPQAIEAARRAAELDDKFKDFNKTIQALNPEAKLTSVVQLGTGIAGAFTAAQGAMALLGDESEDVGRAILKVQAALAVTQGLNSVLQLKDAFRDLRIVLGLTSLAGKGAAASIKAVTSALITNPITLAIAAIAALIAAFQNAKAKTDALIDSMKGQTEAITDQQREIRDLELDYQLAIGTIDEYGAALERLNLDKLRKEQELTARAQEQAAEAAKTFGTTLVDNIPIQLRFITNMFGMKSSSEKFREESKKAEDQLKSERSELEKWFDLQKKILEAREQERLKAEAQRKELERLNEERAEERAWLDEIGDGIKLIDTLFGSLNPKQELLVELTAKYNNALSKGPAALREFRNELLKLADTFDKIPDKLQDREISVGVTLSTDEIEQLVEDSEFRDKLTNIFGDLGWDDLTSEQLDSVRDTFKEFESQAKEIFFSLFDAIAQGFRNNAQELEEFKTRRLEGYDEEAEALELANERKLISDGQLARKQEELAKKREATEKELNKRIAEEKRKAFIVQKAASIIQVAINTRESITKTMAILGFPAATPFIAIAAALGAAQAAIIAAQPIPKFARGVIGLKGRGTSTSDSIPAMLSAGESVMTAKETSLFKPTLEAIRANRVNPELLNNVAVNHQFGPVEAYMDGGKLVRSQRKVIPQQADAIGRAVARYMKTEAYYSPLRS